MQTIILVSSTEEARGLPVKNGPGTKVMHVQQALGAFEGMYVAAVYITLGALQHPKASYVLDVLRRNAAKTAPAGLERVI